MPQMSLHSSVGDLTVTEEQGAIVALDWGWGRDQSRSPLLEHAACQLEDYFDGRRSSFDLPMQPAGTPFQRRVWQAMCAIPAGDTRTYGELAAALDGVARAVGRACGANPVPILIPCHRVVAAASLGGYSGLGRLDTKIALLRREGALL